MPTVVQQNTSLSLTVNGNEVNCQLTNVTFNPGGTGAPDVMLTACPDGAIASVGSYSPGTLTATVAGDTQDGGITTLLLDALEDNAEAACVLTMHDDQGATIAWQYTFNAHVGPFDLPFARPGTFMHDISLTLTGPATRARPA